MPDAFSNEPSVIERTRVALKAPPQPPWRAVLAKVKNLALAKSPAWLAASLSPESRDVEDFKMEPQHFDKWCWAAVGASIGWLSSVGSKPKQCEVAQHQVTDQGDCCEGPWYVHSKPYNKPGSLRTALEFARCYRDMRCHVDNSDGHCMGIDPKPLLAEIQNEIRDRNPVCFRIGWDERRHFVVISGFRAGGLVVVKDPDGATTKQYVNYNHFPATEEGARLWNTYFIKRD
jgi:hypothetical protein